MENEKQIARPIRFRAWNADTGMLKDIRLEAAHGIRLISPDDLQQHNVSDDKYVFMQYTGLKDKNGKEIYEGDIIHRKFRKVLNSPNWLVRWDSLKGRWIFMRINEGKIVFGSFALTSKYAFDYEIIGNIYDNPDLLK